ncbi:MAG: helix-turn-helix domain-containing protein [Candidatus Pseudobacter hemicellulosilyticus]|uniref:Helix-turn-helix domain-containing protein n=1 Tax=Candidatus Pseudobacter hemicellulosilyticus TaxID=3121375 RepID=A0AAJ5WS45_9BACT|nr:MAG: helix-turn-helix domain-containing protein [Pseudobacter sp.]
MEKRGSTDSKRSQEIARLYLEFIDRHIEDVASGRVMQFMELNHIARALTVSHQHLTDTVQKVLGHHPCHFYDARIIDKARQLLADPHLSIADIALTLTYDPSNFSKFFKKWTGTTPGEYRKSNK